MIAQPSIIPSATPFDSVADSYDHDFSTSLIGLAQRSAVWSEMDRVFHSGQHILELNCGTGVDALHLGARGVRVDAFDSSRRMIQVARAKPAAGVPVRFEVLEIERLDCVRGLYDGALSNFGGLNCVQDIAGIADELARLVRPGGTVLLCLCSRVCAWEFAWYLARRQPRKAFRRFRGGRTAHVGSAQLRVWYPTVGQLKRAFSLAFRLRRWKGIGVLVPPSYAESLASRHAAWISRAASADRVLSRLPLFRAVADHVLLEFQRLEPRA